MKKPKLSEVMSKVYVTILERFGEPIGKAAAVPGVPDEREDEGTEMTGTRTVRTIGETRWRVNPEEVITTWEDLYAEQGVVSLEELASWLGTTPDVVTAALPEWLYVDDNGDVIEGAGSYNAVAEAKRPSKKAVKSRVKETKK